jgi:hypothetical protein
MVRTKEPRNRFKGIHSARLCSLARFGGFQFLYCNFAQNIPPRIGYLALQNGWLRKMKHFAQTKTKQAVTILVTKQSIVVDPDQDLGQAQWPQYKKK